MKLGVLKDIFIEHPITTIYVKSPINPTLRTVTKAEFDPRTRSVMFLHMTEDPPIRTNTIYAVKAYMLDFKNTHTVYAINDDTDSRVHILSTEYELDKEKGVLTLTMLN